MHKHINADAVDAIKNRHYMNDYLDSARNEQKAYS